MTIPSRHVAPALLAGYVGGRLSEEDEVFLEQHLLGCAMCRGEVSSALPPSADRLDAVWNNVVDVLDRPSATPIERALHRVGMNRETARLVAAAPSLRLPWLAAMTTCLLLAVVAAAAGGVRGSWLFLTLAPLIPVASVVAAYGPRTDPAWELARATPYSLARLTLLRVAAILVTTIPLAIIVGVLLPGIEWWVGAVWLLPALSFVALTLWLGTYVEPLVAAAVLAIGWAVVTGAAAVHRSSPHVLLQPAVQLAFAAVVVVAALGVHARTDRLSGRLGPA